MLTVKIEANEMHFCYLMSFHFLKDILKNKQKNAVPAVRKICGIYGDDVRAESNVHK